eukprot:505432-Amphidinium_carterae.1
MGSLSYLNVLLKDQLTEGKRELAKSLTSLKRHGSACGTSQAPCQPTQARHSIKEQFLQMIAVSTAVDT